VGLTVIDAGVVIAVLDGADAHHTGAIEAMRAARERGDVVVLPASGYAECLVAPSRRGNEAVSTVDRFLDSMPIGIEPVSRPIAMAAASLRAEHGQLRLPDALIVATAIEIHADRIVTTDRRWPQVRVPVQLVSTEVRPDATTTPRSTS
jgi:predicted nucleic acid-binding protein